jgi:biotin carboxyl carrier protein
MAFGFSSKKEDLVYIAQTASGKNYVFKLGDKGDIHINRKLARVKVVEENGFTFLVWKEVKYPVEVLEKRQNKYVILINGVSYNISVETPFSFKRKKRLDQLKVASKNEAIRAPMPGKIVDVLVEENAMVKEGDSIVILEAMKMQNEIITHVAGRVKSILIRPEDIVNKDDILVEIEK